MSHITRWRCPESNRNASRHLVLDQACLPVPPHRLVWRHRDSNADGLRPPGPKPGVSPVPPCRRLKRCPPPAHQPPRGDCCAERTPGLGRATLFRYASALSLRSWRQPAPGRLVLRRPSDIAKVTGEPRSRCPLGHSQVLYRVSYGHRTGGDDAIRTRTTSSVGRVSTPLR